MMVPYIERDDLISYAEIASDVCSRDCEEAECPDTVVDGDNYHIFATC